MPTAPPAFTFRIRGQGLIAELIGGIVAAFSPLVDAFHIDPRPCLPAPQPPDLQRYAEIAALLALAVAMLLLEPYALRLRPALLGRYEAGRSRERAAWLQQHILRGRMSFVKYARRSARRRFGGTRAAGRDERVRCVELLRAKLDRCGEHACWH